MKTKFGMFFLLVLVVISVSCATGQYMEMKSKENAEVLGLVQSTFLVSGSFRYRSTINTQAYITLLAEAQNKYPDINIDIRDISWAIGQGDAANNNYEYTAIGKVIKQQ
ncbi:putative lipoprotein [Treponema primitia ZAS-2]|uniref:Putative lipoprotein n=1 Tax=Treponema primitia (strain ATCC BAA-887 / DSM 12427 / ZAS-2) TaxID=545694 RepID=F5YLT5_TREPZ|nr:hypothetical protein [Treponema primitia]AEF85225.1 putative lipoprotein [Treponema primitia ZAS-2]